MADQRALGDPMLSLGCVVLEEEVTQDTSTVSVHVSDTLGRRRARLVHKSARIISSKTDGCFKRPDDPVNACCGHRGSNVVDIISSQAWFRSRFPAKMRRTGVRRE
jgi:hypothetical protein